MADVGLELIGRWVLDARRNAGLSQLQLERLTDVDQTTISRLERAMLPGLSLSRLAAIVGCLAQRTGATGARSPFVR